MNNKNICSTTGSIQIFLVRSSMTRLSLFLLLCLLPLVAQAAAIESLRTFVQRTHTFKAVFAQTLLDKNLQIVQEASGVMMFERPGKFRWTYDKPYQQLIVGDGVKVWFYDQDLNQVTVRQLDLAIGSSPAALLAGSSTIERNFDLKEIEVQDEMEWLEAIPKAKESTFELIRMGFRARASCAKWCCATTSGNLLYWYLLISLPILYSRLIYFSSPRRKGLM